MKIVYSARNRATKSETNCKSLDCVLIIHLTFTANDIMSIYEPTYNIDNFI